MSETQDPFADVVEVEGGFSIPELKWRELLFIRALVPEGDGFVRDPRRPLPPFRLPDLFPEGVRFRAERARGRVRVLRAAPGGQGAGPPAGPDPAGSGPHL
jgi:hypothetical protein